MANYIDEEILCEGYTHLEIDTFSDKVALEKLKKDMVAFMHERAKFLLGEDVKIVVEFEEGSLKTAVKVIGSASLAIGIAVNQYGGFRGGIKQITDDVTMLAQASNLELIFRTKTTACDRVRLESRKGVFGRVDSLLSELDRLRPAFKDEGVPFKPIELKEYNATVSALADWERKADKVFEKLSDQSATECIAAGLLEELEKLPQTAPWEKELNKKAFRAQLALTDANRAAQLAGAAASYATTIRVVKNNLMARLEGSKSALG